MRSTLLASCLLLAGCAGTAGSSMPSNMAGTSHPAGASLMLSIHWPGRSIAVASVRRRQYLSASTQSVKIAVNAGTPQYFNAPTSGAPSVTEAVVTAPIGNDTLAVDSYDGINGTGNHLGGSSSPQTVAANTANALSVTLDAIVASIHLDPVGAQLLSGSQSAGYSLLGGTTTQTFAISAYDADANLIVGAGAPTLSLAGSDPHYAITQVPGHSGEFTVTPTTSPAAAAQLDLIASETGEPTVTAHVTVTAAPTIYAFAYGGSVNIYDEQGNAVASGGRFAGMIAPDRICYDPHNNELYVLDGENYATPTSYQIFAFTLDGSSVALSGAFPGMQYPGGLAYGGAGQIISGGFDGPSWQVFTYDEQGNTAGPPYGDASTTFHINSIIVDPTLGYRRYVLNQDGGAMTYFGTSAFNGDGTNYVLAGNFPGVGDASNLAIEPGNDTVLIPDSATGAVHTYTDEGLPKVLSGAFPGVNAGNLPFGIAYDATMGLVFIGADSGILEFDANGNAVSTASAFPGSPQTYSLVVVP